MKEASNLSASRAAREPLGAREIESCLFNAAWMHCLPGRKTCMLDCRWWQSLNHPPLPGLAFEAEWSRWEAARTHSPYCSKPTVLAGPPLAYSGLLEVLVRHPRSCAASDLCRGGEQRLTLTYDSNAYCDG